LLPWSYVYPENRDHTDFGMGPPRLNPALLEGMVIGISFTIGIPNIFKIEGIHVGWIKNCVKGAEPEGLGDFGPQVWCSANPR